MVVNIVLVRFEPAILHFPPDRNEDGLLRNKFFLSLVCVDTTATGWFFIDDSN